MCPTIDQTMYEAGIAFLKPESLKLAIGDRFIFTIQAPHRIGTAKDGKQMFSIAVKSDTLEGFFPLNKTHLRMLVLTLGDNSDTWLNATFIAIVVPQNNPQTKQPVKSWSLLPDSIRKGSPQKTINILNRETLV